MLNLLVALLNCGVVATSPPEVELVGAASIAGTERDLSGLRDVLSEGTPHDRLGSFGSAIAYTGVGNRYIAACDRGPADGASEYRCRWQTLEIDVSPGSSATVTARVTATTLLTGKDGAKLVGAITPRSRSDQRFDPEGLRVSGAGSVWISEEYGPSIEEFTIEGKWVRSLAIPEKFRPERMGEGPKGEFPPEVKRGRYPNKGFEGLAISPDGSRLMAIAQGPLIQDGGTGSGSKARHVRMLEIDLRTGKQREFAYAMSSAKSGVCEVLAVDDERYLVLERDGGVGAAKRLCAVYEVTIAGATDISGRDSLASGDLPGDVVAVGQRKFLDLMDPKYGIAGPRMAEKFEGLAFGPELPDGRRLLIVTVDNDMKPGAPTLIYAFAFAPEALPSLKRQQFDSSLSEANVGAGP